MNSKLEIYEFDYLLGEMCLGGLFSGILVTGGD